MSDVSEDPLAAAQAAMDERVTSLADDIWREIKATREGVRMSHDPTLKLLIQACSVVAVQQQMALERQVLTALRKINDTVITMKDSAR